MRTDATRHFGVGIHSQNILPDASRNYQTQIANLGRDCELRHIRKRHPGLCIEDTIWTKDFQTDRRSCLFEYSMSFFRSWRSPLTHQFGVHFSSTMHFTVCASRMTISGTHLSIFWLDQYGICLWQIRYAERMVQDSLETSLRIDPIAALNCGPNFSEYLKYCFPHFWHLPSHLKK